MLLVLVVQDAGLRSTLVAQLSLAGASLITARDMHDPVLERSVRKPSVLVVEHCAVADQAVGFLDGLLDQPRWHKLVVLVGPEGCPDPDPRLIYLDPRTAPATLAAQLPKWKAEAAVRP